MGDGHGEMELSGGTLRWPSHFPPTGRWKRFFIGVRSLGPDLSFFRGFRELQRQRDESSLAAWPEGEQRDAAVLMGRAFQAALGWPKPYFLPGDCFSVIAYGPRFVSLDHMGWDVAAVEIEEQLHRKFPAGFWQRFETQNTSFGEVVAAVLALPCSTEERKKRWRFWQ